MLAFPIPHFQKTYLVMPCHQNSYASCVNRFIPDPDGLMADTSQVEISGDLHDQFDVVS